MRSKDVIDRAPWVSGAGATLLVASQYTSGPLSSFLCLASLVICSASLGALITHFPGR